MIQIPTTYDQKKEPDIYKLWELSGYFNPNNLTGEPFTIIMPPPNANGAVHLGHAAFVTPEDIIIRYQRMRGRKTLWLPGTDHAGFETQVVFEKELEKQGRSRFKMTREEFYQETWKFVQKYKQATEEGIKGLGASTDWSRNMFTLDPRVIKIVYETFKKMYDDGLIYRGNRICNWCPKHQTGLADLETAYEERTDPLYYIKYGELEVATVRPETIFGDVALAVNPKDKRYKTFLGKEMDLPQEFTEIFGIAKIKIISDEGVDKKFGTGVIKVTPAHDALDFDIWQRHQTKIEGPKQVIEKRGRMDLSGTKYHGIKVSEARKMVVADLQKANLITETSEQYKHNVALCYKCKNVIEPLIVPQWYVTMTKEVKSQKLKVKSSLRDMAVTAVKKKQITIIPKRFEKIFMHWMNNIRDWPISRQIWWGIPIPVWYSAKGGQIKIGEHSPGEGWVQDPDTFDTWFSSGQWPYAALKANSEKDLETFYPTDVMETGWEILFFWVARMIMFGLYLTDKVPFHTVYLHGILRDKEGQKMSKSKGNVIDPKVMTERYGVDALRMAVTVGNLPGKDSSLSEDKIRGYRNFSNKIWNAARFVLQNTHELINEQATGSAPIYRLNKEDKAILKDLEKFATQITKKLEKCDFAHAAEDLYHYFWHTFADKIIEESKPKLADPKKRASAQLMIKQMLETQLKLLHPFMPFVTEAIWQLTHKKLLMIQKWPATNVRKH